jgi:hypothetical protein
MVSNSPRNSVVRSAHFRWQQPWENGMTWFIETDQLHRDASLQWMLTWIDAIAS